MRKIHVRTHNAFAAEAALHGRPLEFIEDVVSAPKVELDDGAAMRAMIAAQERKRRERGIV